LEYSKEAFIEALVELVVGDDLVSILFYFNHQNTKLKFNSQSMLLSHLGSKSYVSFSTKA
jgi:hypothetical protein